MKLKVAKWERWLEEIKTQVVSLMWSRLIFTETFDIIRANEALPRQNSLYRAMGMWYAASVLVGLRRQLKSSDQSISLARLLEEIAAQPEALSRKRWRKLHEGFPLAEWADRGFDQFAADREFIDPEAVRSDLAQLKTLTAKCEAYVDKRLAHHDRGKEPKTPTYDDLNRALDELDRVFRKYYLVVTANNTMTLPSIAYNWKRVFQQPWLPPAP